MGVLTEIQQEPGLHCTVPCGREVRNVSIKQCTMDLPNSKIADKNGNPVMVSAILNYRVVNSKKALLNVEHYSKFINTNAQAVLKQTVSTFTYDQLKEHHNEVNAQMQASLAPILVVAGVEVTTMCLNDLSYAPEVAAA